jgi:uncharacterized LabA/DUF88 family protein
MAFIDSGYLRAGARKFFSVQGPVHLDGQEVDTWASYAYRTNDSARVLRTYVYDGALPPEDKGYAEQRSHFDDLAAQPGIRLRLGHQTERQGGTGRAYYEQKGVDTLLVLDLVRMAQKGAFDVAMIVAGDRDLAEALRVIADDYSRRVIVYGVPGSEPHKELLQVADDWGLVDEHALASMTGQQTQLAAIRERAANKRAAAVQAPAPE